MPKQKPLQLTVVSMEKAIGDLLVAHNAILDAWFEDWQRQQQVRISSSVKQENALYDSTEKHFEY